ncbi:hypothetical protein Metvu_0320 [Methanocaldococcus vulcanius M7]|uniref:Uncharacterized protein n=1 Tax=Methanocaldococcus vulcanius (strain ATCC 700851 / DSM 12094 / M7) TaxID=579137 RepID=C9RF35_METVM|nr:hypothetical protein [Methanocaldococcus vulcanius]ACX72187.1 hypothetical protein Metvu_0320 [Methanocaldococcus vulcanius M7]
MINSVFAEGAYYSYTWKDFVVDTIVGEDLYHFATGQKYNGWGLAFDVITLIPLAKVLKAVKISKGIKALALAGKVEKKLPKAYMIAKNGGKHSGLLEKYEKKSTREIYKAMKSYLKQVEIHRDKINNPTKYIPNFYQLSDKEQKGLLNKWKKDMERNQELADIMKGILIERGELR